MIIERLDLRAFGQFTDVSLDLSAGPRRFHLIYGANESGKSTSLRAITSLMFGMSHVTEDNFLHNNASMRVGGVLVDEAGNRLECIRRRGRKATLRDAEDKEVIDEASLEEMIGGISRETFKTRFGLSHDELVAGGASILKGEGDLGQILFAAGAGVSQLREIQKELDDAAAKLFTPRGTKTAINSAIRDLDEKRKELRQAQVAPAAFVELQQRIDDKRNESSDLNEAMKSCAVELARLQSYQQALPLLPQWRSAIQALAQRSDAPKLDDGFTERRRQAITDRDVAISRHVEFEKRIAELTTRLDASPEDSLVRQHESEIQAVFQEVAARDKADRDQVDLVRVQRNADRKIIDLLRGLSVEIQSDSDDVDRAEAIGESVERLRVSDTLRTRIEELASQYERLIVQRNDSSDAVETTKRRLADTTQELDSLAVPGDPAVLSAAIDSIGAPQTLLDVLAEHRESEDRVSRRCDDLLRRLVGFDGTVEQAVALNPPNESVLQRLAEKLKLAHQKQVALEQRASEHSEDLEHARRRAQQQSTSEPLPTADQLDAARAQRDRAADQVADLAHSKNDVDQALDTLRENIRLADKLVDTMRMHHEQIHHREAELAKVKAIQTQLRETEDAVANAKKDLEACKEAWLQAWEDCGVKAASPKQMQKWLSDHEQLVEAKLRLADDEKRLEQTQVKIQRAAARLRKALASAQSKKQVKVGSSMSQGGLFDDPPEDDLVSLYDEAVALRSSWLRSSKQYDALTRRRDELVEELPQAEIRFEACQKAVEDWRQDWRRITESFVAAEQSTPQVVRTMLRQIDELAAKKRERDILATRIRSISEDKLAFASRVERLCSATGQVSPQQTAAERTSPGHLDDHSPRNDLAAEPSPTAIAQVLYQRLQTERTAAKSRETLREQLDITKQKLAEVAAQRTACEAALKQLCIEAGCQAADDLPMIEQAAREYQDLQASVRDLENQLGLLAGDQPIDAFVQAAGDQQAAILEVKIEQKEAELRELREKLSQSQQQLGAVQHELNLMDGSARASELMQSIQFSAGHISREVQVYAQTKVASLILRRAIDHYRQENQSPVLAFAEKYFAELSGEEYRGLKVDYDTKGKSTLFGLRSDGGEVPAGVMSTGTADALYLSLRLASLEHQLGHGTPIPLIVDDCLVQLDDRRAAAALQALSQLSEKTQVILFTHHRHLQDLAEQTLRAGDFHSHELGSRSLHAPSLS